MNRLNVFSNIDIKAALRKSTLFLLVWTGIMFSIKALFPFEEIKSINNHTVEKNVKGEAVQYQLVEGRARDWSTLNEISRYAVYAIVLSEDWAFFEHSGFDLDQIKMAVIEAIKGKRIRGASTISQQLMKMLLLDQGKTFKRKFLEAFYTAYLEYAVPKNKILEAYLNMAEFGRGIYGIRAAAKYYFHKSPSNLSPKEGAFLAMLLPSPKKYSESFYKKELTPYAEKTISNILHKLKSVQIINSQDFQSAKNNMLSWEKSPQLGEIHF